MKNRVAALTPDEICPVGAMRTIATRRVGTPAAGAGMIV